jgi:hypothetical protein
VKLLDGRPGSLGNSGCVDDHHVLFVAEAIRRDPGAPIRRRAYLDRDQLVTNEGGAQLKAKVIEQWTIMHGDKDLASVFLAQGPQQFAGDRAAELAGCATLISHYRQIKPHDALAVGNVGEIKDACAEFDQKIRVVSEQDSDNLNLAYVAVRQVRTDNLELLELLAQDVWSDVTSAAIPIATVGPWRKK